MNSRDLIEEVADLEAEDSDQPLSDDQLERRDTLRAVLKEIGDEARYGIELIPERDFTDYARDLAEDAGAIPEGYSWPTSCIDWERAANELSMDYTAVDLDGTTYLFRE